MSKSVKTPFDSLFSSNRDRLINIILDEITFLVEMHNKVEGLPSKEAILQAIEKLEGLLKIQGFEASSIISQEDSKELMAFILETVRKVYAVIEAEGC